MQNILFAILGRTHHAGLIYVDLPRPAYNNKPMNFASQGRIHCITLMITMSVALFFGGPSSAADVKPVQKPALQKPVEKIAIRSVDPSNIRTEPGKSVTATASGTSLDKITQVSVLLGNSVTGSIQATLTGASANARQVTFRVARDAKPAKYQVRVTGGNQTVTVPAAVFSIEVVGQQKPVVSAPIQQKQTAAGPVSKTGPVTASRPTSPPAAGSVQPPASGASGTTSGSTTTKPGTTTTGDFKPIVVSTQKLTATIKQTGSALTANQPVDIRTEKLTATIKETASSLKPNEPVVINTDKLTATIKKTEAGY
jgi:hypothetical protein